jgi:hypothetical protein
MRRMGRTEALLAAGLLALAGLAVGCNGKTSSVEATETVTVTEPPSTEPVETVTVSAPATVEAAKIGPGAPTRRVEFGHIRSLRRSEDGYVLRFDPAEYLTGVTASDAMQEDTGSSDVPNDNYVVDEGHRLLTYRVPADAKLTVVALGPTNIPVTIEALAKMVAGDQAAPWQPITSGFWLRARTDRVLSLDQQYRP